MPYKLSSLESVVSWVHTVSTDRHVVNSSFSGVNEHSPSYMVHDTSTSIVVWWRWSVEACRLSAECDSRGFDSSFTSGEVDRLLTIVKRYTSWKAKIKILVVARTWESYWKLLIIFESFLLVCSPYFHTRVRDRGSYNTPKMVYH